MFNKGDKNKLLIINEQVMTRSIGFKFDKFDFSKEIGKNWLTHRVVDWMSGTLSRHVVSANMIENFEEKVG